MTLRWRTPSARRPPGRRSCRSTARARRSNGVERKATILRWNSATLDDDIKQVRGQVLVVTRLPPGGVCHVGYVDGRANPNANELAQQIADRHARSFKCGTDKPIVLGAKGPGFSGPYGAD